MDEVAVHGRTVRDGLNVTPRDASRFAEKVDVVELGCWRWLAWCDSKGCGRFRWTHGGYERGASMVTSTRPALQDLPNWLRVAARHSSAVWSIVPAWRSENARVRRVPNMRAERESGPRSSQVRPFCELAATVGSQKELTHCDRTPHSDTRPPRRTLRTTRQSRKQRLPNHPAHKTGSRHICERP